ncbi:AAA family ATPase [Mucilaginibacter sp. Mucisp86]|uniref:AAA family ATPase n=1 Tax=Mucilaginibacter sp. Mucisp86 TaxID=3243060 RepID=UPI0039B573A4
MDNIKIKSLGPIKEADINFGDLTLFVGPQASGKSILLQLIKLLNDKENIEITLGQYGFIWGNNEQDNLDRFFGEGMSGIWTNETKIESDGNPFPIDFLLPEKLKALTDFRDRVFYVPAQRVICLNYGWPRFFLDFEDSVPFVLREFSETLRQYLDSGLKDDESSIFPQTDFLKSQLNDSFDQSIFHGGKVIIEKTAKKRLKLNINDVSLPFMTWSAGQKEFMPLLLSFYWLCPPNKFGRRKGIRYVIIEEPEMGLHPQAVKSVILQMMDLLTRGYKVIVSTHSPVLLEFAWAYNFLKQSKANSKAFDQLFDLKQTDQTKSIFEGELKDKIINTYYFERCNNEVSVKDISSLDAGSEDISISEWGGLSSFSAKANDIVSTIAANNG